MEPDKPHFRLTRKSTEQPSEKQLHADTAAQSAKNAPIQFTSVEEMIRLDASQTPLPPQILERLRNTLADKPAPVSWWRRFLFWRSL